MPEQSHVGRVAALGSLVTLVVAAMLSGSGCTTTLEGSIAIGSDVDGALTESGDKGDTAVASAAASKRSSAAPTETTPAPGSTSEAESGRTGPGRATTSRATMNGAATQGETTSDGVSTGSPSAPLTAPSRAAVTTMDVRQVPPVSTERPVDVLRQALADLDQGYHFATTVTLDGEVLVAAEGERVGDSTSIVIDDPIGRIHYRLTTSGGWVRFGEENWQPLAEAPARADPLDALRQATKVSVLRTDGMSTTLSVQVSAVELGVGTDPDTDAPVRVRIHENRLAAVGYTTTVDGRLATVEAVIEPRHNPSPVAPTTTASSAPDTTFASANLSSEA